MTVVVRFAPSPTGALHIGSVRTALFNWLFARHYGGSFLLRIEDTDRERSNPVNSESIFKILKWLQLDWDGQPVIQSKNVERHREVAQKLVNDGKAFFCSCSPEELAAKKEAAIKDGKPYKYDGSCRGQTTARSPKSAIRLLSENVGSTHLFDLVQGRVSIDNSQLDDLVLIRSDGTPTYMLSVVVDDHDMGITHVIRGDDHLTNTFRQMQIYQACGWEIPEFGHIPLIYGPDGAKLSKRHGAASAQEYIQLGYLPDSIFNYLLRLGWSHGDAEIISRSEAVEWFDVRDVGKSPARFDIAKLRNLNAHYTKLMDDQVLLELALPFIEQQPISPKQKNDSLLGMKSLKERAKTLVELAESIKIYLSAPKIFDDACLKYATKEHISLLQSFLHIVETSDEPLEEETLLAAAKSLTAANGMKLVEIAQAIRGALCGNLSSPSVFEIITIIGKTETSRRIKGFITNMLC